MSDLEAFLRRADILLERLERIVPPGPPAADWEGAVAFRWHKDARGGHFTAIYQPHSIAPEDLRGLERQLVELDRNTRQFTAGLPANNALLWGARGTGKSSVVKAMLTAYSLRGLRLIEVDKQDLIDLSLIVEQLRDRPEHFLLFCDDLSFEADDASYKALKAVLDGSVSTPPANVLIYATSNRRHLLPEFMSENRDTRIVNGELHHGEAVEEKISLSERFGIWLSFHPFSQDTYLDIVQHWLGRLGIAGELDAETRRKALEWALTRGSRSGRVAWQFALDQAGRKGLAQQSGL